MSIYKLDGITRNHGSQTILEAIDLTFDQGKIYALVGENGCGKTTLLETLALLEAPQAGRLIFQDKPVNFKTGLSGLRQQIAFCLQQPLMFNTSVLNNIIFGLKARQDKAAREKAVRISNIFKIASLLNKNAAHLSGGEVQKVALVRTFVLNTPVLLLDEPTANLDEAGIELLEELLTQNINQGKTIVLATHQLDKAFRLANEVITIKDKKAFPESHQNFFSGEVVKHNGLTSLRLNDLVSFTLLTDKQGRVKVSIDPKEIILSKETFRSSARNCLTGKVSSIIDEGKVVKVFADCGIKLVSQITHKSLEELGINVGQQIYLTFKTSSIKVY